MRCWKDLCFALLVVALVAPLLMMDFPSRNYDYQIFGASVGVPFPVSDIEYLFTARLNAIIIIGCSGCRVPVAGVLDSLMEGIKQLHQIGVCVIWWCLRRRWLQWY